MGEDQVNGASGLRMSKSQLHRNMILLSILIQAQTNLFSEHPKGLNGVLITD